MEREKKMDINQNYISYYKFLKKTLAGSCEGSEKIFNRFKYWQLLSSECQFRYFLVVLCLSLFLRFQLSKEPAYQVIPGLLVSSFLRSDKLLEESNVYVINRVFFMINESCLLVIATGKILPVSPNIKSYWLKNKCSKNQNFQHI